jgi:hypothetical protein
MSGTHPPTAPDQYTREELLRVFDEVWLRFVEQDTGRLLADTRIDQRMLADNAEELDFGDFLQDVEDELGFEFDRQELDRFFGQDPKMSREAWEEHIGPQLTFGRLADLVAPRAVPLRMRPMRILGKHCTPAGAFAAIQQIMVRLTPSCQRFGPSTPIDDVLPRGSQKHKLWRRANYAAQGALPRLLPPPDPSWWLAVCSYGLLATLLRICVLDCYSSSFTLAIPLWIVLLLIWGITADLRDKPLPNQIRTFGDLARAMAGEGVSPTTADE